MQYFNEKPEITKRQPHKRKAEKTIEQESCKVLFERFLEFKMKQNLRPKTLNKFVYRLKLLKYFTNHKTSNV